RLARCRIAGFRPVGCGRNRGRNRAAHVLQVDDHLRRPSIVAGCLPRPGPRDDALCEVSGGCRRRIHCGVVQGEMTMVTVASDTPDTMISPETGEVLRRDARPFVVTYKGRSRTVDLPGYYPESGNDGIHVGADMAVTDAALRALKEEVQGIPSP